MDDRGRMFLAIALLLLVAILPSLLTKRTAPAETLVPGPSGGPADNTRAAAEPAVSEPVTPQPSIGAEEMPNAPETNGDEVVYVRSGLYRYGFSTRGARLVEATLYNYRSLRVGESAPAQIIPDDSEFLDFHLVFQNDTVNLSDWHFEPSEEVLDVTQLGQSLTWVARRGPATVRLTYAFDPAHYLFTVEGAIEGIESGSGLLLVGLGPHIRSVEADTLDDQRAYGIVTKARKTENLKFRSLDPGERQPLDGPFEWVAIKSKYFIAAVLSIEPGQPPFGGGVAIGGEDTGKSRARASALASLPMPSNTFSFSVYAGPQEYRRLAAIGHDLQDANPYGWIFRPIIKPVSVLIVNALLWLHQNLNMAYGWALVLFGVSIRVLLWPLNQKAMRSQMALQALQPEIEALKKKYDGDQQRIGQEQLKLYKERGVHPLGGCLPMMLPMPILFAFFFVFLNTIELRGVPWLWLPDLSRPDPLFIIPVLMGLSMFAVSKLGQKGVPPNPQAKMMLYVMPAFMTFLFLRFSSGLNLYYASQNLASIPQQWLVAKERMKRAGTPP
jgi:YidC/Oxa1 family membrane protein insertase